MPAVCDFPVLDTPAKCAALWPKYPQKVVGMWATGLGRQNVDVLWRLRQELISLGVPVLFLFKESARQMLQSLITEDRDSLSHGTENIYQLDDLKLFPFLNFIDVLVTNDYVVYSPTDAMYIPARLVCMPHNANPDSPTFWNYFYDYCVCNLSEFSGFDYSFYPDAAKIHRNHFLTQLVADYPKLDLLDEERRKIEEQRQKSASAQSAPILLCYPAYLNIGLTMQAISPELCAENWIKVIRDFLAWREEGFVVFRTMPCDRNHPIVQKTRAIFANDERFVFDEKDDNKFWLARADYFVTDYSEAFRNFCLVAKKPAIRMMHGQTEVDPKRDTWGWHASRPNQVIPLLEEMDRDESLWRELLTEKQKQEMPTLGHSFSLLSRMIQRIFNNDDDPAWPRLDKGHTPCETYGDMLKLVKLWTGTEPVTKYHLDCMELFLNNVLKNSTIPGVQRLWVFPLRKVMTSGLDVIYPDAVASTTSAFLDNAFASLQFSQVIGWLRNIMRKNSDRAAASFLVGITSVHLSRYHKKRLLFLLLMEWRSWDSAILQKVNDCATQMPQHFSMRVLQLLNRFLPLAMRIPLPLRRYAAMILGLKKKLARKYWLAHRALA